MASIRSDRDIVPVNAARGSPSFILTAALLLLTASLLIASRVVNADELDKIVAFNIDAQTLDKALLEFGAQTHVQILFAWDSSRARLRIRELKGRYTGKEALTAILKGTRLIYIAQGNTLEILPLAMAASRRSPRASKSAAQRQADSLNPNVSEAKSPDPVGSNQSAQSGHSVEALGEVMVTAQKYRQSAFDVPISLDVVTAHELQRLNITSLSDLQYDVPGLYVQGGDVYQYIVLRGVSNLSGNGAIVGQYIDEADISAGGYVGQVGYGTGNVQLYDLDRVEVLKGPQGTLYGDGAMGGVIHYITNKPILDHAELSDDISALFTQYGAPSQRIEAMLNAPLVPGSFGVRVAGQFQKDGGWVDEPSADLKNINDRTLTDVRVEALWQPNERFKALATQVIHREAYGIGAGEDSSGNITPVYGVMSPPNGQQSLNLSNLTATLDFASAELLSSSTYLTHTESDYNQSYALTNEVELLDYLPIANHTFSEELRLHSVNDSTWRWIVGGFYKHELDHDDDGSSEYYGSPGPISTASYFYINGQTQQSNTDAAFADASITVLKRLTVGAGARYFQSRFNIVSYGDLLDNRLVFPPSNAREDFTSVDPRFYVEYRETSHVNFYASAAKGFRSGEPNLGLFRGFNPESLWSYDLGTKIRFLGNRLYSNVDVFRANYSNYVGEGLITVNGVPTFGTFNIGAATIKGVDADVTWWVTDRWKISAKGEGVDSKFSSITAGDTGFMLGERVPFVPSETFMGSVERELRWADKPGFAQIDYSQTARVQGFSSAAFQSDVIRFLNFRIGVQWNRNLTLAFFAENLLNDRGYLDPYWNEAAAYRPRPRTFGIDFASTLK